jgi:hypothetical protein
MQCATALIAARVRKLETQREGVSRALREETAQVLGSVLVELAALGENGAVVDVLPDLGELQAAVRSELIHVLSLATELGRPVEL